MSWYITEFDSNFIKCKGCKKLFSHRGTNVKRKNKCPKCKINNYGMNPNRNLSREEKYLNELLYTIKLIHLDMGGNHRYMLSAKSHKLISEIKAWQEGRSQNERTRNCNKINRPD